MSPSELQPSQAPGSPVEPDYTRPVRRRNTGLFFFLTIAVVAFVVWMIFLMFNQFGKPIGFIR